MSIILHAVRVILTGRVEAAPAPEHQAQQASRSSHDSAMTNQQVNIRLTLRLNVFHYSTRQDLEISESYLEIT